MVVAVALLVRVNPACSAYLAMIFVRPCSESEFMRRASCSKVSNAPEESSTG